METLIRNGMVFDGTGGPPRKLDIGLADHRIQAVGEKISGTAVQVIDAEGLFVSPGFIDVHSHGDFLSYFSGDVRTSRINQGITTDLSGQCGLGPAPCSAGMKDWQSYISPVIGNPQEATWQWPEFGSFLTEMEQQTCPHHRAYLVAHGAIKSYVAGMMDRPPSEKELVRMGEVLREALDAGAYGMSFGLSYLPGLYADTREIQYLADILKEYSRIFMVHIRSHSVEIHGAVEEMLEIGRRTGVKMHISHLKSYANRAYGVAGSTLRSQIQRAFEDEGIDITYDEHPYTAGSTTLSQVLPPWVREGGATRMMERLENPTVLCRLQKELSDPGFSISGWDNYSAIAGWDNIVISAVVHDRNKSYENISIRKLSELWGTDETEAAIRFIRDERGASCMVMASIFSDEDLEVLLGSELYLIGSDGIPTGTPHPRLFGTFPLFLRKMVRERGMLSWEKALHIITGKSAQRVGLTKKGFIRIGADADLVIFDPQTLDVPEDYHNPRALPVGIQYVFVDGKETLKEKHETGRVLRAGSGLYRS